MILFEIARDFPEQEYLCTLYQAVIALGCYGLMQIGELAKDLQNRSDHSIKNKNINVGINKEKILTVLYSSKTHDKSTYPQQIKISACDSKRKQKIGERFFCPFQCLRKYIAIRSPEVTELDANFLGGLSLHLNHLIASRAANYDWPFGTLPFGLFGSNLDTRDLETYPRTYSGHF